MEIKKPPFRTWIAVMVFFTTAINYTFRSSFQITLIAMWNNPERNESDPLEDYGERYNWTKTEKAELTSGFYYGYVVGTAVAGPICEYFGPYWTCLVGTTTGMILTFISTFVAADSWIPLFVFRVITGLLGGVHYPAVQTLIGNWAPPNEKSKFGSCLMGNVFGTVFSQYFTGLIIKTTGHWTSGFYFNTVCVFLFVIAWALVVSDVPEQSWWCGDQEIQQIAQLQGGAVKAGKSKPPLKEMFTSIPYIALVVSHWGNMWGLYMYLTVIPTFMSHVLKFDLEEVGFWASAPSLARLLSGFVFGSIADYLLRNGILSRLYIRKGFTIFSHIIPGLIFLVFLIAGDEAAVVVSLLVLAMVFNGSLVATTLVNTQDLAPNYAGTQYGIITFFGSMTGFIIPKIVNKLTEEESTMKEWSGLFVLSGIIYIACGCVFILFGSVNLQPWNEK